MTSSASALRLPSPSVLLVSYDLKTPGWNYGPFYEALKLQGPWWHYLSTTWLIATAKNPQQVHAALAHLLTPQDLILIVPITRPYWGSLPKDAWDWIEKNIPKPLLLGIPPPPPYL